MRRGRRSALWSRTIGGWLVLLGLMMAAVHPAIAQTTDWSAIVMAAKPAVVWIRCDVKGGTSAGTGALISPDGYILTAAHVVEGATRITVLVEETREYGASLVVQDAKAGVALLKITASDLVWLALGDSDALALEQEIRLLGYPEQQIGFGLLIGRGFFLGRRKTADAELLQLLAEPFDQDHSGGPILNTQGEVVGVAVGGYVTAEKLFPELKDSPALIYENMLAVAVNSARKSIPSHILPTTPSPVCPPTVTTPPPPSPAMALIRGGPFQMGDPFGEGYFGERPVRMVITVIVSAFYMDRFEVTKGLWDEVASWASSHGYDIGPADGSGVAPAHPVRYVSWYEAVKWANARSEKEGLTPCYYADATHRTVYRSGMVGVQNEWVKWTANGYRLPTEAEWEKAARGQLVGARYSWGNDISCARANYWGCVRSTTPVGSYAANGYGLYDMTGNVWEWCWDWYSPDLPGGVDPRGPGSGSLRVARGGGWDRSADSFSTYYRVANSASFVWMYLGSRDLGFRLVRTAP